MPKDCYDCYDCRPKAKTQSKKKKTTRKGYDDSDCSCSDCNPRSCGSCSCSDCEPRSSRKKKRSSAAGRGKGKEEYCSCSDCEPQTKSKKERTKKRASNAASSRK